MARHRPRPQATRILGIGQTVPPDPRPNGRAILLGSLSEREFQALVVEGLKERGYAVFFFPEMRLTRAGWLDLTFWHPLRPGLIYSWELKTETGVVSPDQHAVLAHLQTVPGIDARVVRPADWDVLKEQM